MLPDKSLSIVGLFFITILIAVTGCTMSDTSLSTPTREVIAAASTISLTRVLPSSTPLSSTSTPSPLPSTTPVPSLTSMPTMHSTPTETLMPTPTLTDTELEQLALELFETNNGCQLPCWWGITPGQTEWETAYQLIKIFDRIPHRVSVNSELVFYEPHIPLPLEIFGDSGTGQFYDVQNGIVIGIETQVAIGHIPDGYLTPYTLASFLATYGQPTEVWLSTYPAAREGDSLPFSVILFYPEQGIVAKYRGNGEEHEDYVRGCPQTNPVSYLSLFPPNSKKTFQATRVGTSGLSEWRYLRLEESTEMDVLTFYQTFKNSDNTTCLETPDKNWYR